VDDSKPIFARPSETAFQEFRSSGVAGVQELHRVVDSPDFRTNTTRIEERIERTAR
jgi:hypothetical protein